MAITTIGTHGIGTDVIVAADIAANAVTASELADDAVDTDAIADDAVTYAKLQNLGTANRVLGSASTGLIGEVQIATAMIADNAVDGAKIALASQAAGDIMYYNGTDWIRLAKGTADQVLTMNDGATAPGWEAASAGAALSGSTNNTVVTVTGANAMIGEANLTFDGSVLSLASSNNGAANQILIDNDSDTAGSHSQLRLKVQGSSSGDPFIDFTEAGSGQDWSMGIDVSASEWKICKNADLATGDVFVIDESGAITMPLQPVVFAVNTSRDANVTGDAAAFTVDFDTEVFDQNADFANDTFTAPVTGRYLISVGIMLVGTTAVSHQYIICKLIASNRTVRMHHESYLAGNVRDRHWINAARIIDMDASDTVTVQVVVNGESSNVIDIEGSGSSDCHTSVSVALIA